MLTLLMSNLLANSLIEGGAEKLFDNISQLPPNQIEQIEFEYRLFKQLSSEPDRVRELHLFLKDKDIGQVAMIVYSSICDCQRKLGHFSFIDLLELYTKLTFREFNSDDIIALVCKQKPYQEDK